MLVRNDGRVFTTKTGTASAPSRRAIRTRRLRDCSASASTRASASPTRRGLSPARSRCRSRGRAKSCSQSRRRAPCRGSEVPSSSCRSRRAARRATGRSQRSSRSSSARSRRRSSSWRRCRRSWCAGRSTATSARTTSGSSARSRASGACRTALATARALAPPLFSMPHQIDLSAVVLKASETGEAMQQWQMVQVTAKLEVKPKIRLHHSTLKGLATTLKKHMPKSVRVRLTYDWPHAGVRSGRLRKREHRRRQRPHLRWRRPERPALRPLASTSRASSS